MRIEQIKSLQRLSFWFALLLHLFIFLFFSYVWLQRTKSQEPAETFIPSFAYQESPQKPMPQNQAAKNTPVEDVQKKKIPVSKYGIEKPVFDEKKVRFNEVVDISPRQSSEPVHLIGDKNKTPQPLIILIAKALTAKLLYPKSAIDLTIGGVSVIGFVLHPDGQVTDVKLLKSSRVSVLDEAAVSAAGEISPIRNVAPYVKEPMPIVFGIIFGSPRN